MFKVRNYVFHHLIKNTTCKTEFYLCANEHDQLVYKLCSVRILLSLGRYFLRLLKKQHLNVDPIVQTNFILI